MKFSCVNIILFPWCEKFKEQINIKMYNRYCEIRRKFLKERGTWAGERGKQRKQKEKIQGSYASGFTEKKDLC